MEKKMANTGENEVEENVKRNLPFLLSGGEAKKVLSGIYKYYENIVLKKGGWREQNNSDNKVRYVRCDKNNEEIKDAADFQDEVIRYMELDMRKDISKHYGHFSKGGDGGAFYKRYKINREDIENYNAALLPAFEKYTINNGSEYVDIGICDPNRAWVLALGGIGMIGLILSGGGTDKKIDDGANNPDIIYTDLNVSSSDNNISISEYNFNKYDENISDIETMLNRLNETTANCSDNTSERLTFNNFIDKYDGLLSNKTIAEKDKNVSADYVENWGRELEKLRADIEKYSIRTDINCSPKVNETKKVSTPTNKTLECSSKITEEFDDYHNIKDFFNNTKCCAYENGEPKGCDLTGIKVGSCPGKDSEYGDLPRCNIPSGGGGGSGGSGYVPPQPQPLPADNVIPDDTGTTQGTTGKTGNDNNNNNNNNNGESQPSNPNGATI